MLRIIDLYIAEDHFRLEDIHAILQEIAEMNVHGIELDRAILLSRSTPTYEVNEDDVTSGLIKV